MKRSLALSLVKGRLSDFADTGEYQAGDADGMLPGQNRSYTSRNHCTKLRISRGEIYYLKGCDC